MSDTISGESNLGRRLKKLERHEKLRITGVGHDVPIVGRITIGRNRGNSIQIDDTLVSRHHALVHRIGSEYFVKDLESTNGTFVNGMRVPWGSYARLGRGDVLRIGRTELSLL